MRRVALAVSISGVLLLAAWVQAPASTSREITGPTASEIDAAEQAAQSVAPVTRQVDEEADRLRQRLAARVPFTPPARDPFRFKSKTGSEPFSTDSREKGSDPVISAPLPVAVPTLVGLTEDTVDGVVVRTAVLSMGDDLAIVKAGQAFSRFVVRSIGPASVELVDVTSPNKTVTTITIR